MAALIDFSQYEPKKSPPVKKISQVIIKPVSNDSNYSESDYRLTIDILVHNNPQKITFTIDETASLMSVNKEFIRRRIKAGKIRAMYYGDKPMVHISELAKILTEGIK